MNEPIIKDYIVLNDDEIRELLNKYDREELEYLDSVFFFAMSHDLKRVREIADEIYNKKAYNYNQDITKKNNLLSYKELNFLYNIAMDGSICAANVDEIDYSTERMELDRLTDSLYSEMEDRYIPESKTFKKIKRRLNNGF